MCIYIYSCASTVARLRALLSFEIWMQWQTFVHSFSNEPVSYHEVAVHDDEVNVWLPTPIDHLGPVEFGFSSSIGHDRSAELSSTTSHYHIRVHLASPILNFIEEELITVWWQNHAHSTRTPSQSEPIRKKSLWSHQTALNLEVWFILQVLIYSRVSTSYKSLALSMQSRKLPGAA